MSEPAQEFDPREIFAALGRNEVAYVTVGGVALQAHGAQRNTRDIDVVVATESVNFERLAAALRELDARILGPGGARSSAPPSAGLLASSDLWHLVGPHGALDVLTLPAHLGTFAGLRARAHDVALGELVVPIASRDDLLAMKRSSDRPQDAADVAVLEAMNEADYS